MNIVLYNYDADVKEEIEPVDTLSYAADHEDFLQIVNLTYNDADLRSWEPAEKMNGDPNEPGYLGKPVILSPEMAKEAKEREAENYFNVIVSEMISINRTLDDYRVPEYVYVWFRSLFVLLIIYFLVMTLQVFICAVS